MNWRRDVSGSDPTHENLGWVGSGHDPTQPKYKFLDPGSWTHGSDPRVQLFSLENIHKVILHEADFSFFFNFEGQGII